MVGLELDRRIFGWITRIVGRKYLPVRSFLSLVISQLADTTLFSFLALYGVVASVTDVIIVATVIKIVVAVCATPFTALARPIVRFVRGRSGPCCGGGDCGMIYR